MPPLKKRSRQAKQQRVSGGKCFDAGLADVLLDVEMDPPYSPKGGPEEADNVEFDADFPWAFSLLEPTEEAGTDEEGPVELVQVGSKRNVDRFEEEHSKDETGGMDLEAECAEAAARKLRILEQSICIKMASIWADPTADDEDEPEMQDTYKTVQKLISEAKRYKSFTSLVHLYAVKSFLELQEKYHNPSQITNLVMRASYTVAVSIGKGPYFARKIGTLHKYIQNFQTLPPTNAGKHHAHPSLLNNERIAQAVRRYLTVLANGEITPLKLQRQVSTVIIPALGLELGGQKIPENCARRWLMKLGYELKEVRKGMYVDGHEREDVVEYRKTFLAEVSKNARPVK
ncbi:hypothetical protein JB92DRAFT_3121644 [Gautieria morchelliformis]|nr:hypothetical protein JB92DRAFT_3121644 [Gautieria morchelliformis]